MIRVALSSTGINHAVPSSLETKICPILKREKSKQLAQLANDMHECFIKSKAFSMNVADRFARLSEKLQNQQSIKARAGRL